MAPLLMVILHVPGSVLRFSQLAGVQNSMSGEEERFWASAQALCDPIHGAISVVIWIFTDPAACVEWRDFLCRGVSMRGDTTPSPSQEAPRSSPLHHHKPNASVDIWGHRPSDQFSSASVEITHDSNRFSRRDLEAVGVASSPDGAVPGGGDVYAEGEGAETPPRPGVFPNPLLFTSDSHKHLSGQSQLRVSFSASSDGGGAEEGEGDETF